MQRYERGDWVFVAGLGKAQVARVNPCGYDDWQLVCKLPDQPDAEVQVQASNVEPSSPPLRPGHLRLICLNGVRLD